MFWYFLVCKAHGDFAEVFYLELAKEFGEVTVENAGDEVQFDLFASDSDYCSIFTVLLSLFILKFPQFHIFIIRKHVLQPRKSPIQRHIPPSNTTKSSRKNHQLHPMRHQFPRRINPYPPPSPLHKYNQSFLRLENIHQLQIIYMRLHGIQMFIDIVHTAFERSTVMNTLNLLFSHSYDLVSPVGPCYHFLRFDELLL
jgi:hypothetical protein